MRAREFIRENTHKKLDVADPSLSNARVYPGTDKYYQFYRMSLDLASATQDSAGNCDNSNATNDDPIAIAYSDVEAKMLDKVAKKRGFKSKATSAGKSREMSDTHAVSPVAKFKPTKRPG